MDVDAAHHTWIGNNFYHFIRSYERKNQCIRSSMMHDCFWIFIAVYLNRYNSCYHDNRIFMQYTLSCVYIYIYIHTHTHTQC